MSLDIVLPMSLDSFVTYVPDRFILRWRGYMSRSRLTRSLSICS